MIQQYLQQITDQKLQQQQQAAQAAQQQQQSQLTSQLTQGGPILSTSTIGSSAMSSTAGYPIQQSSTLQNTPLAGLLQQSPAASLSNGPHKSRLLQWTQQANTGETADSAEETTTEGNNTPVNEPERTSTPTISKNIDPISAKWGLIAAPKLSPTPPEFKPGVRWKPREERSLSGGMVTSPLVEEDEKEQEEERIREEMAANSKTLDSEATFEERSEIGRFDDKAVRPPPGLNSVNVFPQQPPSSQQPSAQHSQPSTQLPQEPGPRLSWVIVQGFVSTIDPTGIRALCQQYGPLLHLRLINNLVYVRYQSVENAVKAKMALDGQTVYNCLLTAVMASDEDCERAINDSIQTNMSQQMVPVQQQQQQPNVSQQNMPPGVQPLYQQHHSSVVQKPIGSSPIPHQSTATMQPGHPAAIHQPIGQPQPTPQHQVMATQHNSPIGPPPIPIGHQPHPASHQPQQQPTGNMEASPTPMQQMGLPQPPPQMSSSHQQMSQQQQSQLGQQMGQPPQYHMTSSLGALWTTPSFMAPLQGQQFQSQSFQPLSMGSQGLGMGGGSGFGGGNFGSTYGVQTGAAGGYSPWGMTSVQQNPHPQPVTNSTLMPNSAHLWGSSQQQPTQPSQQSVSSNAGFPHQQPSQQQSLAGSHGGNMFSSASARQQSQQSTAFTAGFPGQQQQPQQQQHSSWMQPPPQHSDPLSLPFQAMNFGPSEFQPIAQ